MKKYFTIAILSLLVFVSCKKSNTTQPEEIALTYYPLQTGLHYNYNISISYSIPFLKPNPISGACAMSYGAQVFRNGINYFQKTDTSWDAYGTCVKTSFIRKTNYGVYVFVDSDSVLNPLPDSIKKDATFDKELALVIFPLEKNKSWTVFKMSQPNSPLIEFSAISTGLDSVDFQLTDLNMKAEAQKVDYTLTMYKPEVGIHRNYKTTVWFVKNIGIVKMEGSDEILSLFSGGNFPFTISTNKGFRVQLLTKFTK
ncbi:MAG: hypothetical protein M0P61_01640 [Ignavibacteriaceae bacterium]|nr:hypothetical protein [Ignavibacteriaceae bacterium]